MKYQVIFSNQFEKDYQKLKKRGKDMVKLQTIIKLLAEGKQLDKKHREHTLKGKYAGVQECHIEPDWLLCWIVDKGRLILLFTRTGTHSDLF
ncbi:MAG: type II toxin-antitoxin system YafQ family toxin [Firmicutes bacterium]|nr:type II toxin-antitoxin system YafQ family toxin [Bacillota bacterium]